MTWYVEIPIVSGRRHFLELSEKIDNKKLGDNVEYNSGGWEDGSCNIISPHLKFDDLNDALIYVLSYGGEITQSIPLKVFKLKENIFRKL
jgi:hypothetical protein